MDKSNSQSDDPLDRLMKLRTNLREGYNESIKSELSDTKGSYLVPDNEPIYINWITGEGAVIDATVVSIRVWKSELKIIAGQIINEDENYISADDILTDSLHDLALSINRKLNKNTYGK